MSVRRQSVVAVVAALFLAGAIIGGLTLQMQRSSSPQAQSLGAGTLSVAVTDPPTAPAGVTAAYVSYGGVQVHMTRAGNSSGWYTVAASGTLQLFSIVNVSQTIGTANVPSGSYNLVKFNVTAATVTYDGQNYTAFVPSGEFVVAIGGGLVINGTSAPSGVLLDLTTNIANIGSKSLPEFIISPAVHVFAFPKGQFNADDAHQGHEIPTSSMAWLNSDNHGDHGPNNSIYITSVVLSNSSISVTVTNRGQSTVVLQTLLVGPLANGSRSDHPPLQAAFTFLSNGTIVPVAHASTSSDREGSDSNSTVRSFYALAANSSITFMYSGQLSYISPTCHGDQCSAAASLPSGFASGQQYSVLVAGDGTIASAVATAT